MPQYFGKLPTSDQPWSILGAVNAIQRDDRSVRFECGDSCVVISVLALNLIRVRMAPNGQFMPRRSWAVTLDDLEWAVVPFEVGKQLK
jgi:alpha-glucosidase